ncbi:MAG: cytochrome c biogenesis protein CcdA [Deltaproteobacteria bacterium]|nr:cytochrome c biogenesis protein CcdA [Deltaproteobacteria bacterium]
MILTQEVDGLAALLAGILTFFTPCTLPLLPGWFALVTGLDYSQIKGGAPITVQRRLGVVLSTLFFVIGFTIVFVALGAAASALGDFMWKHHAALRYLGALILTIFGLYLLGFIAPTFFLRDRRPELKARPAGLFGALVVGMAFSAGWTPCSGPILASLLYLAYVKESLSKGIELLTIFSIGLSLPFLVLSVLWSAILPKLAKFSRYSVWINRVLGVIMLVLAVLVAFDKLSLLNLGY